MTIFGKRAPHASREAHRCALCGVPTKQLIWYTWSQPVNWKAEPACHACLSWVTFYWPEQEIV